MDKEDSRSPVFFLNYTDYGMKDRCKRIQQVRLYGVEGGGLKTVAWLLLTDGGKSDAALRGKKSLLLSIL